MLLLVIIIYIIFMGSFFSHAFRSCLSLSPSYVQTAFELCFLWQFSWFCGIMCKQMLRASRLWSSFDLTPYSWRGGSLWQSDVLSPFSFYSFVCSFCSVNIALPLSLPATCTCKILSFLFIPSPFSLSREPWAVVQCPQFLNFCCLLFRNFSCTCRLIDLCPT